MASHKIGSPLRKTIPKVTCVLFYWLASAQVWLFSYGGTFEDVNCESQQARIKPPAVQLKSYAFQGEVVRACIYVISFAALLAGCSINQQTASSSYDLGIQAELAGDYVLAEKHYNNALIDARMGNSPDAGVAAAMYGLGRMKGYLCKYENAEKLLLESLMLEEKATGPGSGNAIKRWLELARFYSDRGLYASSLPYFAYGIPADRKLGAETSDPIALSGALEEYAFALDKSGQTVQAKAARKEAVRLRSSNPGKNAKHIPIRYNRPCST
jgi:hypothetical protein